MSQGCVTADEWQRWHRQPRLHLFLVGVCHSLDRGVSTARGVMGREPERFIRSGEPKAGLIIRGDS